eukprot:1149143-Pelagomonas_calceolata.AAC.8
MGLHMVEGSSCRIILAQGHSEIMPSYSNTAGQPSSKHAESRTLIRVSNSSSPRMASCKWRGVIRFTFKSLEALPANSKTSAQQATIILSGARGNVHSPKMAAVYTAAVAPTRPLAVTRDCRAMAKEKGARSERRG